MNGTLVAWKDATVHVATHALHYGTGIFEGIRAYETKHGSAVYRLPEHMRRLYDSCRVYRMEPPWPAEELSAAVLETVRMRLELPAVRQAAGAVLTAAGGSGGGSSGA